MGKAQRLLAELARLTDRTVLVHGAVAEVTELYRQQGVAMLPTARVAEMPARRSYAGELILAPLSAWGTTWVRRFGERETAFASGLDARPRHPPPQGLATAASSSPTTPTGPACCGRSRRAGPGASS